VLLAATVGLLLLPVVLAGPAAASGRIVLDIPTGSSGAQATAHGILGGRPVHLSLQTPWTPQG
jgi:hypothetical protein